MEKCKCEYSQLIDSRIWPMNTDLVPANYMTNIPKLISTMRDM